MPRQRPANRQSKKKEMTGDIAVSGHSWEYELLQALRRLYFTAETQGRGADDHRRQRSQSSAQSFQNFLHADSPSFY